MQIQQQISAQNCVIEMPTGHEVGYLQNLTIQANYNLQPMKNLYQHTMQAYPIGIAQYQARAERAMVELDSIFGDNNTILDFLNAIQQVKDAVDSENTSSAADRLRQLAEGIGIVTRGVYDLVQGLTSGKATEIEDSIKQLFTGETNIGDLFTIFEFDIKISNPIVRYPDFVSKDIQEFLNKATGNRQNLYMLKKCKVNSRSVVIAPANIAVMEDMTIFAREMEDSVFAQ